VRPVPKLTVDFGDGRTLVTTITGNSIHYVLLPDGRPIDAMPGLWGSKAFLAELHRAEDMAQRLAALEGEARETELQAMHRARLAELGRELRDDAERLEPAQRQALLEQLAKTGAENGAVVDDIVFSTGSFVSFPEGTKRAIEYPIVRALVPDDQGGLRGELGNDVWAALARLHAPECRLDERSREMARRKELGLMATGFDAPRPDASLEPLFAKLQRSVAEDTVRNRYMSGARLHEWFASGTAPSDAGELNRRVYRELFLSPENDAWLGLVPPDAYAGLPLGGRTGSDS
jgi:hypothetical protein